MNRALIAAAALALLAAAAARAQVRTEIPRATNGKPDLSGVWQTINTAHWNLEPHVSEYPVVLELGAQFAVPPGPGVVVGGEIVGSWSRTIAKKRVAIAPRLWRKLTAQESKLVDAAAERYAAFIGLPQA